MSEELKLGKDTNIPANAPNMDGGRITETNSKERESGE